ncbi:MAG: hypothetical protein P8K83_01940, partial [Woeseiaceae bacterium]|nr:hypothetical protein [Woeseiaceae bacterium]
MYRLQPSTQDQHSYPHPILTARVQNGHRLETAFQAFMIALMITALENQKLMAKEEAEPVIR